MNEPMNDLATSTRTLALPQVLDLTAAAPLTENLLSVRGQDVSIDASGVSRLGAQCLQVLLSAIATWKADGARLDFVLPSDDFVETLRRLGIDPTMLKM
jgi:chemotaxis protein CheX